MKAQVENQRELGTITNVSNGKEDHGLTTIWVTVDFDAGCLQGFGGLALIEKELHDSFITDLCEAFNVRSIKELKGKRCYALRCWGFWNDKIEGLESVDTGKRFTITTWRNKALPGKFGSPLEERRRSLEHSILHAKRRLIEQQEELIQLEEGYKDWSKEEP